MKKALLKISAATILAVSLTGCSVQKTNNSPIEKKESLPEEVRNFYWNAKVSPNTLKKTYTEQNSGESFTTSLSRLERAQEKLEEKKKGITDKKVKSFLEVVDAVFVNQRNFDDLVRASGYSDQKEMFENISKTFIHYLAQEHNFDENMVFNFQGRQYKISQYGPMFFKVNTNAYGKAGAYDLNDYKVEGNKVYLYITTPHIDNFQYTVKASYRPNYKEFFEPLAEVNDNAKSQKNVGEVFASTFIFTLAALDYRGDAYVDLEGMDYYPIVKQYIAMEVDDSGKVSIDMDNLLNLLHIKSQKSNDENKVKFSEAEA